MENKSTVQMLSCYIHKDRQAVASCPKCGKFMCKECVEENSDFKLCKSCIEEVNERKNEQTINGFIIHIILSILFVFIAYNVLQDYEPEVVWVSMWILFSLPWGWSAVKKLFNDNTMTGLLIFNNSVWFIAFIIELILAVIAGSFLSPLLIIYEISKITQILSDKKDNVSNN